MSFNLAIQQEDHSIILLLLLHFHLGDEGIINSSSDVLIEFQVQNATIENITYDELTLLTVAGLIARIQSLYPNTLLITPSNFIYIFDVEQIVLDAQRQATHMIGESIKEMILKTSIDHLPLLKGKN